MLAARPEFAKYRLMLRPPKSGMFEPKKKHNWDAPWWAVTPCVADDIWLPSLSKLRQQRQTALPPGSQGAGTDAGAVNDAIDLEAIFLDENMDKLDLSEHRVATPKS